MARSPREEGLRTKTNRMISQRPPWPPMADPGLLTNQEPALSTKLAKVLLVKLVPLMQLNQAFVLLPKVLTANQRWKMMQLGLRKVLQKMIMKSAQTIMKAMNQKERRPRVLPTQRSKVLAQALIRKVKNPRMRREKTRAMLGKMRMIAHEFTFFI